MRHEERPLPLLVLASASPRRVALLEMLGLPFVQRPSTAEAPLVDGAVDPSAWTRQQALAKARDVAATLTSGLVIGADTVVVLDGQVFGKPRDREHAAWMLARLSGRRHEVVTGVAVVDAASGRAEVASTITHVWMRPLSQREIDAYIATGEPMDKAGAYAIQGLGATLVPRIEGCYFNVVGLPLSLLADLLARFGIHVLNGHRREVRA
ncbi:MAG TPA: Maf family protein [Thermaerobacter sp.]